MTTVCIPFRDRGVDPLRARNLVAVADQWASYGHHVLVITDGCTGDDQFNRSRAYNRAAQQTDDNVLVFAESDMLIPRSQITEAITQAEQSPGLVVPFTEYNYLSEQDSEHVRNGADPATFTPQSTIPNRDRKWLRTGPINVLSRQSLHLVGQWDETFQGSQFDDRAMQRAFELTCAPTRWIQGPAYHLWHIPGWKGPHLTKADKAATQANQHRWRLYMQATTPEQIRELTGGTQ